MQESSTIQLNLRRRQIPEDYAVFSRDMEIIISLATGWTDLIQLPCFGMLFCSRHKLVIIEYPKNGIIIIHHSRGSSRSRPPPTTILHLHAAARHRSTLRRHPRPPFSRFLPPPTTGCSHLLTLQRGSPPPTLLLAFALSPFPPINPPHATSSCPTNSARRPPSPTRPTSNPSSSRYRRPCPASSDAASNTCAASTTRPWV